MQAQQSASELGCRNGEGTCLRRQLQGGHAL
jgi:hypothetical protein